MAVVPKHNNGRGQADPTFISGLHLRTELQTTFGPYLKRKGATPANSATAKVPSGQVPGRCQAEAAKSRLQTVVPG